MEYETRQNLNKFKNRGKNLNMTRSTVNLLNYFPSIPITCWCVRWKSQKSPQKLHFILQEKNVTMHLLITSFHFVEVICRLSSFYRHKLPSSLTTGRWSDCWEAIKHREKCRLVKKVTTDLRRAFYW